MSTLFHDDISLPRMRAGRAAGGHQQSSWLDRWLACAERMQQRADLREIADDPHLLADLGLTRDEALEQANTPFWR
jgi:uncharacterized protein YjiS (DUF1127 family)